MRNCAPLLKPIAHRGLHDAAAGRIENTSTAFEAALMKGYGVECDVRPSSCATPMVFHDSTLERLVESCDRVAAHDATALKRLKFRVGDARMIDLAELFELVGGREPILVEIKSTWQPPDRPFLTNVAALARDYHGPLALMSYDPSVMAVLKELAPNVLRGIVSGPIFEEGHWRDVLDAERAYCLSHLLESAIAAPDFYAYQVSALPTAVTRYVREVQGLPLFAWTVTTHVERAIAARWADAPIFEGYEP